MKKIEPSEEPIFDDEIAKNIKSNKYIEHVVGNYSNSHNKNNEMTIIDAYQELINIDPNQELIIPGLVRESIIPEPVRELILPSTHLEVIVDTITKWEHFDIQNKGELLIPEPVREVILDTITEWKDLDLEKVISNSGLTHQPTKNEINIKKADESTEFCWELIKPFITTLCLDASAEKGPGLNVFSFLIPKHWNGGFGILPKENRKENQQHNCEYNFITQESFMWNDIMCKEPVTLPYLTTIYNSTTHLIVAINTGHSNNYNIKMFYRSTFQEVDV